VRAVVSGMDLIEDDLCLSAWNCEHRIFCPRRMQTTYNHTEAIVNTVGCFLTKQFNKHNLCSVCARSCRHGPRILSAQSVSKCNNKNISALPYNLLVGWLVSSLFYDAFSVITLLHR
jgi:hypothetical protein